MLLPTGFRRQKIWCNLHERRKSGGFTFFIKPTVKTEHLVVHYNVLSSYTTILLGGFSRWVCLRKQSRE
jgi:hypothetical protein